MYSFLDSLKHSAAYSHVTGEIILLQTHISYVFVTGDYVYKIKKPVDFGFLDFTSLAKRKYFCEEELRLNSRLCPEIYLEVVPITCTDKKFSVAGDSGEIVEYAVKMVRMPEGRMMNNLISAGKFKPEGIDGIVDRLLPFYSTPSEDSVAGKWASSDAVGRNFRENFQQTEQFVGDPALSGDCFSGICSYTEDFLAQDDLFRKRQEDGRIYDGHGDLHSANICLADKVYIFDCIEFNQRFRYCDVASDVAFLAMDLDHYGLEQLSDQFVASFSEQTNDPGLYSMLNFYKCYRAYVRGKISLFTAHALEVDSITKSFSMERAGRYFELAWRYARG